MSYINGFVAAVPAANKAAYIKSASDAWPLFKEFGVKRMVEAWGDDVMEGKDTDFQRAVKAKDDEVIVFSWFEFESKAAAAAANEKMMTDPRMEGMASDMPFDGMRMIFGDFDTLLDAGSGGDMGYVDGSLMPVATDKKGQLREEMSVKGEVMLEYGATRLVDAWGDDLPKGKVTDFQGAVNATDNETVVFTWIEWPSKQVRDAAWPKIMGDPRMATDGPVDMQRSVFGGFVPVLDNQS